MLRILVALLCAQPSADVVRVLRVECALVNTSDRPLSFVVRENGTVYGPQFGLIHDGKTVKKIRFTVYEGPLCKRRRA